MTAEPVVPVDDSKSQVANAIARAKAKKIAQKNQAQIESLDTLQNNESPSSSQAAPVIIDKKAKVDVAIAKEKANEKKPHTETISDSPNAQVIAAAKVFPTDVVNLVSDDKATQALNKKAKVATAIAKAKAKAKTKTAASLAAETSFDSAEPSTTPPNIDIMQDSMLATKTDIEATKKARVAAVVAKAKAKKIAASSNKSTTSE
jgi:electron transport complex protein RnfC